MILHIPTNTNYLSQKIEDFWIYFKGQILDLTNKSWNEENYTGSSFLQWKTMQYYNTLYLCILIYLDVQQTGGVNTSWSYYENKYNLCKIQKCLACDGIDLKKALEIFDFPFNDIGSIENGEIEISFIIENILPTPQTSILNTNQLLELINNPIGCINNIKSSC